VSTKHLGGDQGLKMVMKANGLASVGDRDWAASIETHFAVSQKCGLSTFQQPS
jgi:hypothetical protein